MVSYFLILYQGASSHYAVVVGLPDVRGRIAILKHHMGEVQYDVEVDPSIIARGCPGMSGADLQNLVNQVSCLILGAGCQLSVSGCG